MANKSIYIKVRINLGSKADEITDEMVDTFLEETLYDFPSAAGLEVTDTEICGREL